jgi:hypothetical protein
LPVDLPRFSQDAAFDAVATPPMQVLRNLTTAFAGSAPLDKPRQLSVEVTALGGQQKVFEGDGAHPPLWHRDVLAVLLSGSLVSSEPLSEAKSNRCG